MSVARMAYYDTDNTGRGCDINTGQGQISLTRVDGAGVLMVAGGQHFELSPNILPFLGRFFLAAATVLGEDVNASWQGEQHEGGGFLLGPPV